jgi:hypothetical protein
MKGEEEDENHDGLKHTVLINCLIVCSLVALWPCGPSLSFFLSFVYLFVFFFLGCVSGLRGKTHLWAMW